MSVGLVVQLIHLIIANLQYSKYLCRSPRSTTETGGKNRKQVLKIRRLLGSQKSPVHQAAASQSESPVHQAAASQSESPVHQAAAGRSESPVHQAAASQSESPVHQATARQSGNPLGGRGRFTLKSSHSQSQTERKQFDQSIRVIQARSRDLISIEPNRRQEVGT